MVQMYHTKLKPNFLNIIRYRVLNLFTECSLASFVSGTTVQKIPYVFLPLQGQIVYPSAEIKISGTYYFILGSWDQG